MSKPQRLDDDKVAMGTLLRVSNLHPEEHTKLTTFEVMHVQNCDGKEFALAFSPYEADKYFIPVMSELFSNIKPGHLYPFNLGKKRYGFIVKCRTSDKADWELCFVSGYIVRRAKQRAERNPEDIPKKSMFTNLFD